MTMKQDIKAEFEVQLKMISDPSIREKVLDTWCKASKIGGWKTIEELRELPFTVITDPKGISLIQHTKAATEGAIALARIQRENIPAFPHVDMNILVAGALLHDINKVLVFERNEKNVFRNRTFPTSEEKHIFPGITIAREAGLPDAIVKVIEYANTVCKHVMATPRNIEAILVHHADITTFDTMNFLNNSAMSRTPDTAQ
jgi:putative nucleotidyltransferase with HDIG domain